jgi:hypothetical protein
MILRDVREVESCHVSNCNVISWNRPFHYFPYLAAPQYIIQLTATSSHCLETMTKKSVKRTFASVQSATLFKLYQDANFQQ